MKAQGRLLGDIGGTNARLAWQDAPGAPTRDVQVLPTSEHATLEAALRHYLRSAALPPPAQAALAIANPVIGDSVRMTNHHWAFSIEATRVALGLERLVVLNDFTALALALPALPDADLRGIGCGQVSAGAAKAVIGPGTGLGASGLLPDGNGGWVPVEGEGGHVTLAARTTREAQVLGWLEAKYGHASAERAISGQGLVDLHAALLALDQAPADGLDAAGITHAALQGHEPRAVEALNLMCALLGTVCGDLALTLGARGGVYLAGGILPRLGSFFDASPFRERFESKGRFSDYLAAIATLLIVAQNSPALLGAERALDAALRRSG
jgi:glucokinase